MKNYEGKDRYQFQPWYIKAWRYSIHRPPSLVRFIWCMVWWTSHGFPDDHWGEGVHPGRLDAIAHYWTICRSEAQYKMGQWWSIEECKEDLAKERLRKITPDNDTLLSWVKHSNPHPELLKDEQEERPW